MLLLERWSISLIQHRNFCIPKIEGREAKGHHKAGGANSAPSHCECCVVTDALIQGKSSCHGPVYEQPGADAEGPAQHLIPDYCRQRLPRARTIALWGRIRGWAVGGTAMSPRSSLVAFGSFVAFHIFCWFALLLKGSIKWKKHMFSEFWQLIQCAMQDSTTIFLFWKRDSPEQALIPSSKLTGN